MATDNGMQAFPSKFQFTIIFLHDDDDVDDDDDADDADDDCAQCFTGWEYYLFMYVNTFKLCIGKSVSRSIYDSFVTSNWIIASNLALLWSQKQQ